MRTSKVLSRADADTASEILKSIRTASEDVRDTALAALCHEIFTPDELQTLAKMIRLPDPEARKNRFRGLSVPWQHGGNPLL